jgi:hypothetical protein
MPHVIQNGSPTADAGRVRRARWLTGLCAVTLLAVVAGCGADNGDRLLPVAGKVALGDRPLTIGVVSFRPDASKGNQSMHHPHGEINAEGRYELTTQGKKGAPPGWYKVLVFADGNTTDNNPPAHPLPPNWLMNVKYTAESTTDLFIEVVETPSAGAYDLTVSK